MGPARFRFLPDWLTHRSKYKLEWKTPKSLLHPNQIRRGRKHRQGSSNSRINIPKCIGYIGVYNQIQYGNNRRRSWETPNKSQKRASTSLLIWSNLPFSAKSKPCGSGSIKVMQSAVQISKRDMRNRQGMATHHVTWEQWSKQEKLRENPITFLKLKPLRTHSWWFSFGREKVEGTERREEHTACGNNKLSVKHLAWGEFESSPCELQTSMLHARNMQGLQDLPYKKRQPEEIVEVLGITDWLHLSTGQISHSTPTPTDSTKVVCCFFSPAQFWVSREFLPPL